MFQVKKKKQIRIPFDALDPTISVLSAKLSDKGRFFLLLSHAPLPIYRRPRNMLRLYPFGFLSAPARCAPSNAIRGSNASLNASKS